MAPFNFCLASCPQGPQIQRGVALIPESSLKQRLPKEIGLSSPLPKDASASCNFRAQGGANSGRPTWEIPRVARLMFRSATGKSPLRCCAIPCSKQWIHLRPFALSGSKRRFSPKMHFKLIALGILALDAIFTSPMSASYLPPEQRDSPEPDDSSLPVPGSHAPAGPTLEEMTVGFWERHGLKIIAAAVAIILAAGVAAYSQWQELKNRREAGEALAAAVTAEEYAAVIAKWPKSPEAALALVEQSNQLREAGDMTGAEKMLNQLIADFPEHELVPGAWVSLGSMQEARDELDAALATYQKVSSQYSDSYAAPLALISEARLYRLLQKPDEARRVYESVITRFPLSVFAPQAGDALDSF